MPSELSERAIEILRRVPAGRVITYGLLAAAAGNPRGARQVVRILHTQSEVHDLPWHRVINAQGKISLPPGNGYELQRAKLESEGIEFEGDGRIDLKRYLHRFEA